MFLGPLTAGTLDASFIIMAAKKKGHKKDAHDKVVVRTARTKSGAVAVHVNAGAHHVVGIGDLRVMIVQEDEACWFARGLEIDFAEQGTSLADVQERFEQSLGDTIREHLTVRGNIRELLHVAPPDVWKEFWTGVTEQQFTLKTVTAHHLLPKPPKSDGKQQQQLPFFKKIHYHTPTTSGAQA